MTEREKVLYNRECYVEGWIAASLEEGFTCDIEEARQAAAREYPLPDEDKTVPLEVSGE